MPRKGRPKGSRNKAPRACVTKQARACAKCGMAFVPQRNALFCSRECIHASLRKPPVACPECGILFRQKSNCGQSRNAKQQYCSRQCGAVASGRIRAHPVAFDHPPAPKSCVRCSSRFIGRSGLYCSTECRRLYANEKASLIYRTERACCVCGDSFIKPYKSGHKATCSAGCNSLRMAREKRAARSKRRHAERAATVRKFDPESVLERDGWRCQLCRVKTPRRLRGTYLPNAPELDHIVPLALGGAHAEWNTQCLCRKCNGDKSATTAGQLRLAI